MTGLSTYETFEATTYPWSVILSFVSFASIFVSFVSPYWLMNHEETGEAPFLNLGLWQVCFSNYRDYRYLYDRIYDGCYWTLDEEMHVIEDQIRRPFFVWVQTLFTLCFVLSILATILTAVLVMCPSDDCEKALLKTTFCMLAVSFVVGFIAILVFAVLGDSRDWMPHWDHNYLSWAYAIAVIGVLLQALSGVLFWIEYRITKRGEQFSSTHGMFPMDTKA